MRVSKIIRDKKGRFISAWAKHRIKCICKTCGNEFETVESRIKKGRGKYCSKKCYFAQPMSQKTKDLISKKKKGKRVSIRTEFKKGQTTGDKSNNWKGDNVGYFALHGWVYRRLGKAKKCSKCSSENNVQWANKSHKYKRKLDDWLELCQKCHRQYDSGENWGKASRKYNL